MSNLKTKLADDAASVFLNTNEFGESISYTSYGSAAKAINAVVIRKRLDPNSQDQNRTLTNQVEIYIANDATDGVASVNKGQDTVSLPAVLGGSNSTWRIVDIMDHDPGFWHLLGQK